MYKFVFAVVLILSITLVGVSAQNAGTTSSGTNNKCANLDATKCGQESLCNYNRTLAKCVSYTCDMRASEKSCNPEGAVAYPCFWLYRKCYTCDGVASTATHCPTGCSNISADATSTTTVSWGCKKSCQAIGSTKCTSTDALAQRCQLYTATTGSNTASGGTTAGSSYCKDLPQCSNHKDSKTCAGTQSCEYGSKGCVARCYLLYTATHCGNAAHCSWNKTTGRCAQITATSCRSAITSSMCKHVTTAGCQWDSMKNTCNTKPCMKRTKTECSFKDASAMGCWYVSTYSSCAPSCTVETQSQCNRNYCHWDHSTSKCSRQCATYNGEHCPTTASSTIAGSTSTTGTPQCQVKTVTSSSSNTGISGSTTSTTKYCKPYPNCGGAKAKNMTLCKMDYSCTVSMDSTTSSDAKSCVVKCGSWYNVELCANAAGCAWNKTIGYCKKEASSITPSRTTTAAPSGTTSSCWKLTLVQCVTAESIKMGCFVAGGKMCASCSDANQCNDKVCEMKSGRCVRKCMTYTTTTACSAIASCQYGHGIKVAVDSTTTILVNCFDKPKCGGYKNMTRCSMDKQCYVTRSSSGSDSTNTIGSTTTTTSATCNTHCLAYKNSAMCALNTNCAWNRTLARCDRHASSIVPTSAPTTHKSCWNMNATMCVSDLGKKMGCFSVGARCGTCSDPNYCVDRACDYTADKKCIRKCITYNTRECVGIARCQHATQPSKMDTGDDITVSISCFDKPKCGMYKTNMTKCKFDKNCFVYSGDATSTGTKNLIPECRTHCLAYKNPEICTSNTHCAWNKTLSRCHKPGASIPIYTRPMETTASATPTTKSCFRMTLDQCATAESVKMGCFVMGGKCMTCQSSDVSTAGSTNTMCNDKVCQMRSGKCVRKCMTFNTATTCPTGACQFGAAVKIAISDATTIAVNCFDMPKCRAWNKFTNMTACKYDNHCYITKTSPATCATKCGVWRNAVICAADSACSWDRTTSACQSSTNPIVHPTTAAPSGEPTPAPAPTKFTPEMCWKATDAKQCNSPAAVLAGCFWMREHNMCGTCNDGKCNEKVCFSYGTRCLRRCPTYGGSDCPSTLCQTVATATASITGIKKLSITCISRPMCGIYRTDKLKCEADRQCMMTPSSTASSTNTISGTSSTSTTTTSYCVARCPAWKNKGTCFADSRCNWNTTAHRCDKATISRPSTCKAASSALSCWGASVPCYWNREKKVCLSRPCANRTAAQCTDGDGENRGCFVTPYKTCSVCSTRSCDMKACFYTPDGACLRRCYAFRDPKECISSDSGCVYNFTRRVCYKRRAPPSNTDDNSGSTGTNTGTSTEPSTSSYVATCSDRDSTNCKTGYPNTMNLRVRQTCVWDKESETCKPFPCSHYTADTCPGKRCQVGANLCKEVCPSTYPVMCSTGVCAASKDRCVSCSSTQVLCWNSKCATSLLECDCPKRRSHRCKSTKRCAVSEDECASTSTNTGVAGNNTCSGSICWDGSCASKETGTTCPCPPSTPIACEQEQQKQLSTASADSTSSSTTTTTIAAKKPLSKCAATKEQCTTGCSGITPVKCWNGECSSSLRSCPCPPKAPIRCRSTGKCAASDDLCGCPEGTTRCTSSDSTATGSIAAASSTCAASCAITCSGTRPFRCEDGSCASESAACKCALKYWKNAVVVVRINARAESNVVIDNNRKYSVAANAYAFACRSKREMTAEFKWVLKDHTDKTYVRLPSAGNNVDGAHVGSVLTAASTLLKHEHKYTLTVVARLVKDGLRKLVKSNVSLIPTGTASISFVARNAALRTEILGGVARKVASSDSVTVTLNPKKLGATVDSTGKWVNLPTNVEWTCKTCSNADEGSTCTGKCPESVTKALSASKNAKVSIAASATSKLPVGNYNITARIKSKDGKKVSTDSQVVIVQDNVERKNEVSIYGIPDKSKLLSSVRAISLYAKTSSRDAKLTWYVNGEKKLMTGTKTDRVLVFPASSLEQGKTYYIKVQASFGTTTASAKAKFTVPTKVSGSCKVAISSDDDSSSSSDSTTAATKLITSLQTPIKIETKWKGVDASQLTFRYGYTLNRGRVWLTPSSSKLSEMNTFIAPMINGNSARTIHFFVYARVSDADSKATVGVAKCTASIVPPSDEKTEDEVKNAARRIEDCKKSNDTSRLAHVVATLSGAASRIKDLVKRKKAQALAIRAVSALVNSTGAEDNDDDDSSSTSTSSNKRDLTRQQRSTIIQGIRSTLSSEESDEKKNRINQVTKLNRTMQALAVRALYKAVKSPKDGAGAKNSMDSRNDAEDALHVLSNTTLGKSKEVAKAAVYLARSLAAQSNLGEKVRKMSKNITITGYRFPGTRAAKIHLNGTNSSIQFPGKLFEEDENEYSVSTTEFRKSPYSDKGTPKNKTIGSSVVDFLVQNNGQKKEIKNLVEKIVLRLKLAKKWMDKIKAERKKLAALVKNKQTTTAAPATVTVTAGTKNTNKKTTEQSLECRYFDEKKQEWSKEGVETVAGVDTKNGEVECKATHLSVYSVFVTTNVEIEDDSTSPTNAPDNNNDNNGAAETTGSGLSSSAKTGVIAGVIGGILVLLVVGLFLRARRNSDRGTGIQNEGTINHLLFAAPEMDYDMELSAVAASNMDRSAVHGGEYAGL